jgi:hypothetical protein
VSFTVITMFAEAVDVVCMLDMVLGAVSKVTILKVATIASID